MGDEDDFVMSVGEADADEFVSLFDFDGDDAASAEVCVFGEVGFFDDAGGGSHDEVFLVAEVFDADEGGDFFAGLHFEDVGEGFAFCGASHFGDFVDFFDVDAAGVGEEHEVVVCGGGEKMFDEIRRLSRFGGVAVAVGFFGDHADDAFAAAALSAVAADGGAFDVAGVGDGDDAAFVGDEVFDVDFAFVGDDLGAAGVGVFFFNFLEFFFDDVEDFFLAGEDAAKFFDELDDFEIFLFDFVAFESGELV